MSRNIAPYTMNQINNPFITYSPMSAFQRFFFWLMGSVFWFVRTFTAELVTIR